MLYSVNMLRKLSAKKLLQGNIVRPHVEVMISVVIGSVFQPSWNWRTVGDLQTHIISFGVAFQLSISFTVVSSTCKVSWRTKLQKLRNVQPHTYWMHMSMKFIKSKKTRKMMHAYNKENTRLIILERYSKGDVSWTQIAPEKKVIIGCIFWELW